MADWPEDELARRARKQRRSPPGSLVAAVFSGDRQAVKDWMDWIIRDVAERTSVRRHGLKAERMHEVLPQYFMPGVNPVPPPTAQGKLDALAELQRKSRDGIRNGEMHSITPEIARRMLELSPLTPKPGDRG